MILTNADLIKIVENSSSIYERMGEDFLTPEFEENNTAANERLNKWCQAVSKGDGEKFKRRLAQDKIDLDKARRLLRGASLKNKDHLPTWVKTLPEILSFASECKVNDGMNKMPDEVGLIEPGRPLPFEELLIPCIILARNKFQQNKGSAYHLLNQKSHHALERMLLKDLSRVAAPTLLLHFAWFKNRSGYDTAFASIFRPESSSTANKCYQAFIKEMLSGGLATFFCQYPVLARLTAQIIEQWIGVVSEFTERLESDWKEIRSNFYNNKDLGQVVDLSPGLSDRHHNGRMVISFSFASGLKLVYKPKNIGIERAYNEFLNWLNDRRPSFSFKTIKVIDRLSYGWVEFVEHLPCKNAEGLKAYYHRTGNLLGVVYALQGTDLHNENIIASAEYPVLVDVEMLLYPRIPGLKGMKAGEQYMPGEAYEKSVLSIGLLPQKDFKMGDKVFDVSGLGGSDGEEKLQVLVWKNINTDEMSYEYDEVQALANPNMPSIKGESIPPRDYVDQVADGFKEVYQFFIENRRAILSQDGPLAAMQDKKLRFVLRATRIYFAMLIKTLEPKYMHNGVDRSIEIERFAYSLLHVSSRYWPLLQAEEIALEQLDIPYFSFWADQNALQVSAEKVIENCFAQTGYESVREHIQNLSETDLKIQTDFIRAAFVTRYWDESSRVNNENDFNLELSDVIPLSQEELKDEAIKVAKELRKRALRKADSVSWIQIDFAVETDCFKLRPMGFGLYHGRCGIAFFLAAMAKVIGGTEYRDLALAALQPLREALNDLQADSVAGKIGIGLAEGLGSVIYSLVKISQFLKEDSILHDAYQAASLINKDMINQDKEFDIIGGAAGVILGLLSLYHVHQNQEVLHKAITCGNHLIHSWVFNKAELSETKTLTGFSHGAAGIACALLRLYEITGESELLITAKRAIAYEQDLFCEEEGNWPDFRQVGNDQENVFMSSWCHGAPGIGLARIGGLSVLNDESIWKDIESSLKTTQDTSLDRSDHLCCGNFGLVDILLTAAQKLSRPDLQKKAMQRASWVIARKRANGQFRYNWSQALPVFGLFQGGAGIGYELLRLAYPEMLPSLLLFD